MADYQRTFWQRFSLSGYRMSGDYELTLRQDYMGNAEYEWGSVPNSLQELREAQAAGTLECRTLKKLPFKLEYYASGEGLPRPRQLTFIGDSAKLDRMLEELEGKTLDNKAGLLQSHPTNATLMWLACEPNTGDRGGVVILNDSWIDQLDRRELVDAMLVNYFNINVQTEN